MQHQRVEDREIWQGLLQDKDDLSLRELGEKYDVAPSAIVAAFKRQGVRRKPAPSGPRDARRRNELPPEPGESTTRSRRSRPKRPAPAGEAQASDKPAPRPGSKDAKLLRYWDQIGKVPDTDVAKRARVSPRTVGKFREHHGIPPAAPISAPESRVEAAAPAEDPNRPKRETPSVRRGRELERILAPFEHLLGQLPDSVVAQLSGLSLQAVRHQRQKRGITAAGKLPQREVEAILREHGLLEQVLGTTEAPAVAAEPTQAAAPPPQAAPPQAAPSQTATPSPTAEAAPSEEAPAAAPEAPAAAPAAAAEPTRPKRTPPPKRAAEQDLQAWRITFRRADDEEVRIVVARSFVEAAGIADAFIGQSGIVWAVESLGLALA